MDVHTWSTYSSDTFEMLHCIVQHEWASMIIDRMILLCVAHTLVHENEKYVTNEWAQSAVSTYHNRPCMLMWLNAMGVLYRDSWTIKLSVSGKLTPREVIVQCFKNQLQE